jgi:outer membrane protein assembly factor BamD
MAIKAYFRFAELSVEEKKAERFEKVVQEAEDFMDRFPDSPLSKDVQDFVNKSKNNLKIYANEPAKTTT